MEQPSDSGASRAPNAYEGRDFGCHTCGCVITVKHWGDASGGEPAGVFLCHCGTILEPEGSSEPDVEAR